MAFSSACEDDPLSASSSHESVNPAWRQPCDGSAGKERHGIVGGHQVARSRAPVLDLDLAVGKTLGTDENWPWQADEFHGREFGARPLVRVIVQNIEPRS